jgi:hypothetical protein
LDISSTCKVGQKFGVSLPLLTCSPSAWPSRLLYRRGRKSRRDLWITVYYTMFVKVHYWKCSGDRGLQIFSSRAACWPAQVYKMPTCMCTRALTSYIGQLIYRFIPYIPPTRCHFLNLFISITLYMFRLAPSPIIRSSDFTYSFWYLSNRAATFCDHGWDRNAVPSQPWSQQVAARFDKYQKLYVQSELLMMGEGSTRNM